MALRACIGANRETPSAGLNARLDTPHAKTFLLDDAALRRLFIFYAALRVRVLCASTNSSTDGYAAAT